MHESCTVYKTMDYLSKKWAVLILFELGRGDEWKRFSDIRDRMRQITPKVLSERLKELEEERLVEHRTFDDAFPVRSEYRLTEAARELMPIIIEIKMWALKWKIDNAPCGRMNCYICKVRASIPGSGTDPGNPLILFLSYFSQSHRDDIPPPSGTCLF